jgi:hypothetical protein
MKSVWGKWGLTLVALLCLAPATLAAKPKRDKGCDDDRQHRDCHQVPEGGSGIIYLLAAGVTCAGAMVIRSCETRRNQA